MQTTGITFGTTPHRPSEQIRKVAQEFESMFTRMMLQSMRKTLGDNGLIPTSMGEKIYTDMLDDEYAKTIGNHASLGLADMIVRELERSENKDASYKDLKTFQAAPWMIDNRFVPGMSSPGAEFSTGARADQINKWQDLILSAGNTHQVDSSLIAAVIAQESGGNPYAVSRAGAKGLMQLMDGTAREMGVAQPFIPKANIDGGTRYLRLMLDKFGGDESLALASYNAGPGAVEKYQGIPPYRETQNYVKSVLSMRRIFAEQGIPGEK